MAGKFKLKKPQATENEILNAVGEYLERHKHFFFRINNAPTFQRDSHGGGFYRRQSKFSMNGVPDFILVTDEGKFIGLEMKTCTGVQSLDQKIFQALCKEKNAGYYIIKNLDDLVAIGL